MSSRSLAGVLFLFAALLLPWIFRDWLPGYNDKPSGSINGELVGVPGFDGPREKRAFEKIEAPDPNSAPAVSRNRNLPEGSVTSFSTSAKSLLNRASRSREVPGNHSSEVIDRHRDRLQGEMSRLGVQLGDPVFFRVFKEEKELELWLLPERRTEFSLFRVYPILKWSGRTGPKTKEGDHQSPEGFYYVPPSRMRPQSKYHMGFDLGYPNEFDKLHGRTGGKNMIHGKSVSLSSYAMGDENIEEIYAIAAAALNGGQPYFRVHCFPFRMEDKVMDPKLVGRDDIEAFWANLKEGYDFFEVMRRPPNVTVSSHGKYYFSHE